MDADAASATSAAGTRPCKQAPISNGCSHAPLKRRFMPGRENSLSSRSSKGSCFTPRLIDGLFSESLMSRVFGS